MVVAVNLGAFEGVGCVLRRRPEGRITVLIVLIRPAVYANLSAASNIAYSSSVTYIYIYIVFCM